MISKARYNEVMSNELVYKENNFVGVAKDIHIFVGCYTYLADFVVLEDVSEFIENGLTEVLLGKPFTYLTFLEERILEGLVWFSNGIGKTIFQMPRTISRFKHLSNEECNKTPHVLILSDEDKENDFGTPTRRLRDSIRVAWIWDRNTRVTKRLL
ncbi:hypothetical protein Tco_0973490 [Tanacetum coccineum]